MNIYVGNLAHSSTEDTLRGLFEQFGEVLSIKIITDRLTGKPRGFAFVEMASKEDTEKAIAALNDQEFEGRRLTVNEAKEREPQRKRFNSY